MSRERAEALARSESARQLRASLAAMKPRRGTLRQSKPRARLLTHRSIISLCHAIPVARVGQMACIRSMKADGVGIDSRG